MYPWIFDINSGMVMSIFEGFAAKSKKILKKCFYDEINVLADLSNYSGYQSLGPK